MNCISLGTLGAHTRHAQYSMHSSSDPLTSEYILHGLAAFFEYKTVHWAYDSTTAIPVDTTHLATRDTVRVANNMSPW